MEVLIEIDHVCKEYPEDDDHIYQIPSTYDDISLEKSWVSDSLQNSPSEAARSSISGDALTPTVWLNGDAGDASGNSIVNDYAHDGCDEMVVSRELMQLDDWSNQFKWRQVVDKDDVLNLFISGSRQNSNAKLWTLRIPTEWWNLLCYGCNFPIIPPLIQGVGGQFNKTSSSWAERILPILAPTKTAETSPFFDPVGPSLLIDGLTTIEHEEPITREGSFADYSEDIESSDEVEQSLNIHVQNSVKGVNRCHKLQALEEIIPKTTRKRSEKKKRGRKSKLEVGSSILREVTKDFVGVDPAIVSLQAVVESAGSGGYLTRARKAYFLCKPAGLSFPGSDEEAIRGFAEELEEDNPRLRLGH